MFEFGYLRQICDQALVDHKTNPDGHQQDETKQQTKREQQPTPPVMLFAPQEGIEFCFNVTLRSHIFSATSHRLWNTDMTRRFGQAACPPRQLVYIADCVTEMRGDKSA